MQSEKLVKLARAKINLCLNIIGTDGAKHLLDTVMMPIDICDTVTMSLSDKNEVFYDGKISPYPFDTVKRTLEAFQKFHDGFVRVDITKRIPEKAGIGGSSADASCVARGLEEMFSIKIDMDLLSDIGSDVPSMYLDCPCRMVGTGKEVMPVGLPKGMKFLLVTGVQGVSTKECFDLYDKIGGENCDVDDMLRRIKNREYFLPTNALQRSACILSPEIEKVLNTLHECGFYAGMTGSGSGVFAYEYDEEKFDEKKAKAISVLKNKYLITTF